MAIDRPAFFVDVTAMDDDDRVGVTFDSLIPGPDYAAMDEPHIGTDVFAVDADNNVADALVVDKKHDWLQLQIVSDWRSTGQQTEGRVSLAGLAPTDALRALLQTVRD